MVFGIVTDRSARGSDAAASKGLHERESGCGRVRGASVERRVARDLDLG